MESAIEDELRKADPNYTKLKTLKAQLGAQVAEDAQCRKLRAELDAHRIKLERSIAAAKASEDYARAEQLKRVLDGMPRTPTEADNKVGLKAAVDMRRIPLLQKAIPQAEQYGIDTAAAKGLLKQCEAEEAAAAAAAAAEAERKRKLAAADLQDATGKQSVPLLQKAIPQAEQHGIDTTAAKRLLKQCKAKQVNMAGRHRRPPSSYPDYTF